MDSGYPPVLVELISSYLIPNLADRFLIFELITNKKVAMNMIDEFEHQQLTSGQVAMKLFHHRINNTVSPATYNQQLWERWELASRLYQEAALSLVRSIVEFPYY